MIISGRNLLKSRIWGRYIALAIGIIPPRHNRPRLGLRLATQASMIIPPMTTPIDMFFMIQPPIECLNRSPFFSLRLRIFLANLNSTNPTLNSQSLFPNRYRLLTKKSPGSSILLQVICRFLGIGAKCGKSSFSVSVYFRIRPLCSKANDLMPHNDTLRL